MKRDFNYIDVHYSQNSKNLRGKCGDRFWIKRDSNGTKILLIDGMGSGAKAFMYATLCLGRFEELLENGFTPKEAFERIVSMMKDAKTNNGPYAAVLFAVIRKSGNVTIFNYEMPGAIIINEHGYAFSADFKPVFTAKELFWESNFFLRTNEYILFFTDGVTEAGEGKSIDDICVMVHTFLRKSEKVNDILEFLKKYVYEADNNNFGDDTTILLCHKRKANVTNIITAPPLLKESDEQFVNQFLDMPGYKIIAGSKTAEIVAEISNKELVKTGFDIANYDFPAYELDGIELVVEGTVTLNEVYNILTKTKSYKGIQRVLLLFTHYLYLADVINIFWGKSNNISHKNIDFVKKGILLREELIPNFAKKLEEEGKEVNIIRV